MISSFYKVIMGWCRLVNGFVIRNRYGLMGTLAFHLIFLILLLLFKLNTRREFVESEIIVEIHEELNEQIEDLSEDDKKNISEEIDSDDNNESIEDLLKSIAVNKNIASVSKSSPKESVEKMIQEIKQDLDQNREYGEESFVDEGFLRDSLQALSDNKKERQLDSLQSVVYSGPSSVYYSLDGRHKIHLPIPVFKCEGEGLVVVEIEVERSGKVSRVRILPTKSQVNDECLFEAARVAARKTRFNSDQISPLIQKGTISYNFVKQ